MDINKKQVKVKRVNDANVPFKKHEWTSKPSEKNPHGKKYEEYQLSLRDGNRTILISLDKYTLEKLAANGPVDIKEKDGKVIPGFWAKVVVLEREG